MTNYPKAVICPPNRSNITAEIVQTYSETTVEQAEAMELPVWTAGSVDVGELGRWNDLLLTTGVLHEPIEMTDLTLQD